jgi:hypothetical protein
VSWQEVTKLSQVHTSECDAKRPSNPPGGVGEERRVGDACFWASNCIEDNNRAGDATECRSILRHEILNQAFVIRDEATLSKQGLAGRGLDWN